MPIERVRMTFPDVMREFPYLEEWFSNPNNTTAQLQEDKRLMSAEEKLALVGGRDQVKSNLETAPRGWRDEYTILLACRQEPMIGYEIAKFGRLVDREPGIAGLYVTIAHLMEADEVRKVEGLTYILRLGSDPTQFNVSENRPGYRTTEHGLRETARKLVTRERRSWLGGLVPVPHRV